MIERERAERSLLETKLREKTQEAMDQQAKHEKQFADGNAKLVTI